ncbi:MAG: hypothetical protein R3E89_18410 [Thiolinea sp.]
MLKILANLGKLHHPTPAAAALMTLLEVIELCKIRSPRFVRVN